MNSAKPPAGAQPALLDLLNQIFEIEKKVSRIEEPNSIDRNIRKMREVFEEGLYRSSNEGLIYHSPLGERYDETRTDCEASISGDSLEGLVVTEVIKPIIYARSGSFKVIVQKAVVIASKPE